MDKKFGDHFGEVFSEAIQKWKVEENYFLNQVQRELRPLSLHDPLSSDPFSFQAFSSHKVGFTRLLDP
jgi:hypothetical protein